jgi:thiamine pyrophosphokinase
MKRNEGIPALIIANGDLPPDGVVRGAARRTRDAGGIIVCADGGARHAVRLRIRPDVILGDLDSVPQSARGAFPRTPILRNSDQESTDLEKALRYCLAAKCGSVVVVGAVGDRIDHSSGALGCLRKYGRMIGMLLLDRAGELRLLGRKETIAVSPGETFSLIPIGRCAGITVKGAEYPLSGEALELGVREGISNRATGRELLIRHGSGTLLLYRLRRPAAPGRPRPRPTSRRPRQPSRRPSRGGAR